LDCDVGIIPWPEVGPAQKVKSINRLVTFMAFGIPVIASPIPSYLEIVKNGENGYMAETSEEWRRHNRIFAR